MKKNFKMQWICIEEVSIKVQRKAIPVAANFRPVQCSLLCPDDQSPGHNFLKRVNHQKIYLLVSFLKFLKLKPNTAPVRGRMIGKRNELK